MDNTTAICKYSHCLHSNREIEKEKAVRVGSSYYHSDCFKTKEDIKEIVDLEEATKRFSKNITAEIIGRVDTTAYDKRVEQRKEKEKLKKELDKRKKEIQKKLDDEYYASKDETYAEMLRQYESL